MKKCENTEFIVLNYYDDGWPFDFILHLHNLRRSIESHREKIALAEKYDLELKDSNSVLPDLISELHMLKSLLKGRFDLVVINEMEDNKKENDS